MLAFLGSLFVAIIVFFAVLFGLDKFWIKDADFADDGSDKMWMSIGIAAAAAILTLIIL